jgi:ribose transport system substrate-binding protein
MHRILSVSLALFVALSIGIIGCNRGGDKDGDQGGGKSAKTNDEKRPSLAFVTNQVADFWKIAKAGAEDAGAEFDVDVQVIMPAEATAVEQKRIVEDLLTSGIQGIAISPVDADNEVDLINSAAKQVPLITHDSDAPGTDRLLYIGMDNYAAGRMCGELVKDAVPDGGEIILFIGRLEQDNSKYRRQGVIDTLLDRDRDAKFYKDQKKSWDPIGEPVKGDKYTILATLTDQGLTPKAKDNAEDAITTYPNLKAMVGLFEYNPPACYEALKLAGQLKKIKLIGFDENSTTLQAIKDGECAGTVVQNPYEYGYQSIKVLAKLNAGDKSVIPESQFIDIPPRIITKENVDEYWADLKAKTGG